MTDVTAMCHPQVRAMAECLANTSRLAAVGIDYLTTDITKPPSETGGAFIEINTTPGLCTCIAAGWSEASIAKLILGTSVGRIPVDLTIISASSLKAFQLEIRNHNMPAGAAIAVGNLLKFEELMLPVNQTEPWAAVSAALRHRGVKHLHAVCSAEELRRLGSPVDCLTQVQVATADGQSVLPSDWVGVLQRLVSGNIAWGPEREVLERLWD